MPEEKHDFNWERAKALFHAIIEDDPIIKNVFPETSFSLEHGVATFRREQNLCLRKDSEREFHFDYYINHVWYKTDCEKLKEIMSRRIYEERTYYNSDYWKQRTRITNETEFKEDLNYILDRIIETSYKENNQQKDTNLPVKIANDVPVDELLSNRIVGAGQNCGHGLWNLKIPEYQRPYCWRESNIKGFLSDIEEWQASKKGVNYHAGTIVLKQQKDGHYDIVDGQQRLTTLAILKHVKVNTRIVTTDDAPGSANASKILLSSKPYYKDEEKQALSRAKRVADSSDWKIDLSHVIVSVVVLGTTQPEDMAYTFFSNSNSTGKRLSDYDLLKTHHLRYVLTEKESKVFSKKWHQLEKSERMDDLLQKMLFRLRKWNNNEKFPYEANERDSHDLFNHFKSVDPLSSFPPCNQTAFRFNSKLTGGREFFSFAEYYQKKYEEFCQLKAINSLEKHLKWHSYGVICDAVKAIAFLFYCKFGDVYINEAVYLLAYRFSVLRNESQVRCSFLCDKSIFSETTQMLDQVTSEAQFFAVLGDVKKRYIRTNTGRTAQWYWNALNNLMNDLSKDSFALEPIKAETKEERN